MKKNLFKPEQIAAILRQCRALEHAVVAEIVRKFGIPPSKRFIGGRSTTVGLSSNQVIELKQLQEENGKLKRLVADLSLDKIMLQDVLSRKWEGSRSVSK